MKLIHQSKFYGLYEKVIDRESVYELLKARSMERKQAKRSDSILESLAKSAARSAGRELDHQILRGVLGSILGGKR